MAYMSTGPALRKSYAPLFTLLMRLGIPLTTSGADTFLVRDELPLWDRQDMDWDDILRCSPALKSLITRSSDDLQALLLTDPAFGTRKLHGSYPLELATRYGWKDGCIMLLKSGATIANSRSAHCATLLTLSIDSGNEQVLSMWLSIRKVATESQLLAIGSLESALAYASQRQVEWVDGILDAIVEQRSTLKKIARQCITDGELMFKDERVLDAGAAQIFDFLAGIDVDVHPSLRPVWRSLYCPLKYNFRDRMIVEKLYDAGFRDVAAEDYDDRDEIPSPLLHCAIYGYVDQCWWFVSKGVKMTECWPRSHVTALQCLGWGAGNALMATNPHQELQRQSTDAFTWSLFADRCTDDCVCGCSVSGCTFSTSFVKGTTTSIFSPWRSKSDILHATLRFAAPATRQRRSLARALIRSLTFWHLGLEHTCCDIKRVWYYHACQINNSLAQEFGGMPEAYFESPFENDKSPVPRHTPEVMQRIRDEDVYLLGRLEELVCDLDREYEALEMDIEEFILEHWCKTMEKDVAISVKQDEQQYGKGRREMGVALELRQHLQFAKTGIIGEIEDEDETHTGPEDTSLEESDGVDEFYDAEENW
ncbi:hypothetical protein CC78DRAFT_338172 [Lojkania enalia]|uniref:Ankyrin repeat protein n=1 Tax=Lojkania enalia TaxID=147567 RepID=A0A9P4K4B6_9PLEO|nr:hypothetical protein CC78DRAFT_338172 [Didymosphaeria enalia]